MVDNFGEFTSVLQGIGGNRSKISDYMGKSMGIELPKVEVGSAVYWVANKCFVESWIGFLENNKEFTF